MTASSAVITSSSPFAPSDPPAIRSPDKNADSELDRMIAEMEDEEDAVASRAAAARVILKKDVGSVRAGRPIALPDVTPKKSPAVVEHQVRMGDG